MKVSKQALESLGFACEHGMEIGNFLVHQGDIFEFFFEFIKINDDAQLVNKIYNTINNILELGKVQNYNHPYSYKLLQLDFKSKLEALYSQDNEQYSCMHNFLRNYGNAYFYKEVE